MPAWNGKTWAGDPAEDAIVRTQDHLEIKCADPAFQDYVCTSYEDLQKLYQIMLSCKKW